MVTIRSSYNVIPNESTPKVRLWMSDLDQVARPRHTPTFYIYKSQHNDDDAIFERLRNSLSKVLVYFYPLAGQLVRTEGGRFELDCNAKGVTLIEAETMKTLQEYGDFSPSESTKELVPKIDNTQTIEELPLLLVQLTRFNCNEGFAIGVAFCHLVADGVGAIHFINSWAKVARGETLDKNEMPFLDRTVLKFSHPPSPPKFDHPELKPPPLKLGASSSIDEQKKKTCAELLKLTPEQVEKLKIKANNEAPKEEGARPYSKFEAIAAHIWRCASKARELDENQPTIIRFNADIRTRLIPPLPKNYFGNALALTATRTCSAGEVTTKSLGYAANKIREAIAVVTNEYIRSQIDVIRAHEEQLDKVRAFYFGQNEGEKALFFGNPNLLITSWMSMPVYEADFGRNKPLYFGQPSVSPQDRALILLNPNGDGSILVCMHFQIAHMQLFKNFFYENI